MLGAGCGSGPTIAIAEFPETALKARCDRLVRCALFPDQAACLSFFRVPADASTPAAVAAGKAHYDGERAAECVDQLADRACDVTAAAGRPEIAACASVYSGTLAGGETCSIDAECKSGTCALPSNCPESGCCAGACRPEAPAGGDGTECAKDRDCKDPLVCARDRTCRAPAVAGGDCGSDHECAAGFACIGARLTMPGTCRPLPHLGDACPYARCADEGLRCNDAGACVALGLVGAACTTGAECSPYLECSATSHTCQQLPTLGEPCTAACRSESFCAFDTNGAGTCTALRANGAPCESINECQSFYCFVGPVFDSCTDPPVCL